MNVIHLFSSKVGVDIYIIPSRIPKPIQPAVINPVTGGPIVIWNWDARLVHVARFGAKSLRRFRVQAAL